VQARLVKQNFWFLFVSYIANLKEKMQKAHFAPYLPQPIVVGV
jgi:hypothetical protein